MKDDELQMVASETGRAGLVFDRQPRESLKAFTAFRAYLDLGAQRSLATVATKLGKSKVLMERWSRRYDWSGRVLAYHEYLTTLERQAIEARAVSKSVEWEKMSEAVRREAWKKSDDLLAMADEFIERWRKSSRVPGFESVVRGVELAIRLKQLATGLPTDTLRVQGQVKATIEVDWEMALRRVYGPNEAPAAVVDVEAVETGDQKSAGSSQTETEQRRIDETAPAKEGA